MMDNTVYIIVPVYNAQKHLSKCVSSLQNQTYSDIEIILVDDGSTDNSGNICDRYSLDDGRISVIHKNNGGPALARKTGIERVPDCGYTTFCDSDDFLPRDGIQKLVDLIKKDNSDIACGTLVRIMARCLHIHPVIPRLLREYKVYEGQMIREELMPSYFGISDFSGYMHTKLYSNKIIKKAANFEYPVKFFQEDIAFNIQAFLLSGKVSVMPDEVYCYRAGGGTSHYMPSFLEDCIALYNYRKELIVQYQLPESMSYTLAVELKNELFTWLSMYYIQYKSTWEVRREIDRCCNIAEIKEAVNYPREDHSGEKGFREMVKTINIDAIYNLLKQNEQNTRIKRAIKKIVMSI